MVERERLQTTTVVIDASAGAAVTMGIITVIFNSFLFVSFIFSIVMLLFFWRNRAELFLTPPIYKNGTWSLPIKITEKRLSEIEGGNPLLKEVIVVAHKVEDPKDALLSAVRNNFGRNINYRFIISNSTYKDEQQKYIKIFEAYAWPNSELVDVHPLGSEWSDVPYIFYRSKRNDEVNDDFIFAYCGSERREGLATDYFLLEPNQAYTIFQLVEKSAGTQILSSAESAFTPNSILNNVTSIEHGKAIRQGRSS